MKGALEPVDLGSQAVSFCAKLSVAALQEDRLHRSHFARLPCPLLLGRRIERAVLVGLLDGIEPGVLLGEQWTLL